MNAQDLDEWIGNIASGDRQALSKAITLMESSRVSDRDLAAQMIRRLPPRSHPALRIGLTGPPGVGKSTLVEALGVYLTDRGERLAVLTVDPSSALSGGSILGDKTRMPELARRENAFIRPSPTGAYLGGTGRQTREAILLCEAAGYDIVLVETAGTGQNEYLVSTMTDITVLLGLPGAGDDLQGIKRGIMEWADVIVVHKADEPNDPRVREALRDLGAAAHFLEARPHGQPRRVVAVSALRGTGLEELWKAICAIREVLVEKNLLGALRAEQLVRAYRERLKADLLERLLGRREVASYLADREKELREGKISPEESVENTLAFIFAANSK
ncbi:MAG: methylmalonyl Co-A mutase-associated GTPase MeaB [Saprospiraceae bacterium]|nr:methylmalonyl Co-A mutase-associated GTPase MeaB [Saprospiraceae bacterium]